jgi:hypothetical protein
LGFIFEEMRLIEHGDGKKENPNPKKENSNPRKENPNPNLVKSSPCTSPSHLTPFLFLY